MAVDRSKLIDQTEQYRCDLCGATFRDPDALEKHRRTHMSTEDEKKELEQGTNPPMGDTGLPPIGNVPVRWT